MTNPEPLDDVTPVGMVDDVVVVVDVTRVADVTIVVDVVGDVGEVLLLMVLALLAC